MGLSDFLLARFAEDEAVAREASPGPWHLNAERDEVLAVDDITVCEGFALSGPQTRATTTHIARWDPARVLAECDAKRRIVAEHPTYRGSRILAVDSSPTDYGCELCHCIDPVRADGIIEANGYCETLLALALPYADHPDYLEEWRP